MSHPRNPKERIYFEVLHMSHQRNPKERIYFEVLHTSHQRNPKERIYFECCRNHTGKLMLQDCNTNAKSVVIVVVNHELLQY